MISAKLTDRGLCLCQACCVMSKRIVEVRYFTLDANRRILRVCEDCLEEASSAIETYFNHAEKP